MAQAAMKYRISSSSAQAQLNGSMCQIENGWLKPNINNKRRKLAAWHHAKLAQ